jgi:hypothetical protein
MHQYQLVVLEVTRLNSRPNPHVRVYLVLSSPSLVNVLLSRVPPKTSKQMQVYSTLQSNMQYVRFCLKIALKQAISADSSVVHPPATSPASCLKYIFNAKAPLTTPPLKSHELLPLRASSKVTALQSSLGSDAEASFSFPWPCPRDPSIPDGRLFLHTMG